MGLPGIIGYVDLNKGAVDIEAFPYEWRKKYLGGRGINAYLSLQRLKKDPSRRESGNVIILGNGILSGIGAAPLECAGFSTRFPLEGRYGFAGIPGGFGAGMRWAGFDHVVISGKKKHPVFLHIRNAGIVLESVEHLKGKGASESSEALRKRRGIRDFRAAGIGPEGENRIHLAPGSNHDGSTFGEARARAFLGDKNVKAIVCQGTRELPVKHPMEFLKLLKEVLDEWADPAGFDHREDFSRGTDLKEQEGAGTATNMSIFQKRERSIMISGRRLPSRTVYGIIADCLGLGCWRFPGDVSETRVLTTLRNLIRLASGSDFSEKELVDVAFRVYALERLIEIQDKKGLSVSKKSTGSSERIHGKEGWDKRSLVKRKAFEELGIEDLWSRM